MTGALLAGLLAGYGVAIPVGAIGALLVSLTARTSMRVGAAAALGVATADLLYAILAVAGGAALASSIAPYATPMRWVAAVILVTLGVRTGITTWHQYRDGGTGTRTVTGPTTPTRAYLALLGLTVLNPATIVYFVALVLGRQASGSQSAPETVAFVAAAGVASASWQLLLASGGSLLGRVLTGARGRLITGLSSAAVIALLAALLVAG